MFPCDSFPQPLTISVCMTASSEMLYRLLTPQTTCQHATVLPISILQLFASICCQPKFKEPLSSSCSFHDKVLTGELLPEPFAARPSYLSYQIRMNMCDTRFSNINSWKEDLWCSSSVLGMQYQWKFLRKKVFLPEAHDSNNQSPLRRYSLKFAGTTVPDSWNRGSTYFLQTQPIYISY